jgi:hypothetical protein
MGRGQQFLGFFVLQFTHRRDAEQIAKHGRAIWVEIRLRDLRVHSAPEAHNITGTAIPIDGGWTAQ